MVPEQDRPVHFATEESGLLVNNAPLTGYEPQFFDYYHFSENTEIFIQEYYSDSRPSNLHDSEISDYIIGRALSSPLFTQEREDAASRGHAYHSPDESSSSSPSSSVGHRTVRPIVEQFDSQFFFYARENPCRDSDCDEINNFFMNHYWNKIENFVKLV